MVVKNINAECVTFQVAKLSVCVLSQKLDEIVQKWSNNVMPLYTKKKKNLSVIYKDASNIQCLIL